MAPRGVPQIEVTFDIDANGILNVTAKDMATGKDQKITITSSCGLSKEEVERMAKEAEAHSAEDKQKREEVETRNQLDGMVYQVEKMLKENGDKISGGERGEVENALGDAKKALEGGDRRSMQTARDRLQTGVAQAGGGHVQGNSARRSRCRKPRAQHRRRCAARRPKPKKDEGVIDAEYVDVEEKK